MFISSKVKKRLNKIKINLFHVEIKITDWGFLKFIFWIKTKDNSGTDGFKLLSWYISTVSFSCPKNPTREQTKNWFRIWINLKWVKNIQLTSDLAKMHIDKLAKRRDMFHLRSSAVRIWPNSISCLIEDNVFVSLITSEFFGS